MRSEYFFGFIISFVIGVAIEETFNLGYSFALLCALISVFVCLASATRSISKNVLVVSFILLGCSIAVFRVDVSQIKQSTHSLDMFTERVIQAEGVVVEEPDVRGTYTNIVLEARSVLYKNRQLVLDTSSLVLVRVPAYPEFKYGDNVVVFGKITLPKNFASKNVGIKSFDYQSYLAKDGIYYQMYFPKTTIVERDKGNVILGKLFTLKMWLIKNISHLIPEPEASLAEGITLGAKQSLGDDLLQKFRETGVAHIVVLSGYNIAVVAGIISRLVSFMSFIPRLLVSALGVVFFAMMVGGGATVVRATIMALIIIIARVLGREGDALRALVLAGGLMVFANPMILLYDVSFQLSFSATLALIIFVPVIERYFLFISSKVFREIIVTTFATQIFVLPLILYHMGSVSLIGLVANIFILPVVPFAMLTVSLVSVFAWVPIAGASFAFVSYVVLAYVIIAVEFFARVPFASLHGIPFPLTALAITYIFLGFFIYKNSVRGIVEKKHEHKF